MQHAEKRRCGFELRLVIRHEPPRTPSAAQRCEELGKFARLLENVGPGMSECLVSGDSTVPAFDSKDPTATLIKSADDAPESPIQFADVWNGLDGKGAAGPMLKYRKCQRSGFAFRAVEISGLEAYEGVADLVEGFQIALATMMGYGDGKTNALVNFRAPEHVTIMMISPPDEASRKAKPQTFSWSAP